MPDFHFTSLGNISSNRSRSPASSPRNNAISLSRTYNGSGNTGGTPPVDGNAYQESAEVTVLGAGTLVKTGYAFNNWNTTEISA